MNKNYTFVACLMLGQLMAQNTPEALDSILAKNQKENRAKLDKIKSQKSAKGLVAKGLHFPESQFGGFLGPIPVPLITTDANGNTAHGITAVQAGTLDNFNQIPLDANNQRTLNGDNIVVSVFDEGAIASHVEFGNLPNRIRVLDQNTTGGVSTLIAAGYHPTFVAGVLANSGQSTSRKGVLPNALLDCYSIYDSSNEANPITRFQKLNTSSANISNHSWGLPQGWYLSGGLWYWYESIITSDRYSGAYGQDDRSFDQIVYANPYKSIIKSSGNTYGKGPTEAQRAMARKFDPVANAFVAFAATDVLPPANCSQGYNCLPTSSAAKNIIVVGATNSLPNNTYGSASDVVHASYSSAGPRLDGAIKPDITAVGSHSSNQYNPNAATALSGYGSNSGTSFSAPLVTGVVGLLTELNQKLAANNNLFLRADQSKVLLCHSAKEAGANPGPDAHNGWGLLDAAAAASTLIKSYNNQAVFRLASKSNDTRDEFLELAATGTEPLKISIAWTDPAATINTPENVNQAADTSSRLVNDLDLRLSPAENLNQEFLPWRLNKANPMLAENGDNTVDNFEQILINNPIAGQVYRLKISHKNNLVDANNQAANQNYALLITGASRANPMGTDSPKELTKADIYPKICQDAVFAINPEQKQLQLINSLGQSLQSISGDELAKFDLSAYPSGVYYIVFQGPKAQSFRFIIQK